MFQVLVAIQSCPWFYFLPCSLFYHTFSSYYTQMKERKKGKFTKERMQTKYTVTLKYLKLKHVFSGVWKTL